MFPSPFHVPPNEQHRGPGSRHHKIGILNAAGEVEKIRILADYCNATRQLAISFAGTVIILSSKTVTVQGVEFLPSFHFGRDILIGI